MKNYFKEQLKLWRLKAEFRARVRPNPEFLKSARNQFTELVRQRGTAIGHVGRSRGWRYATVAAVLTLSLASGLSVFADASNVPADHPLYKFKRLSEEVRLTLSSPDQQVQLHKAFAQRRLEELSELNAQAEPSPAPSGLSSRHQIMAASASLPAQALMRQERVKALEEDFQRETDDGLDQSAAPHIASGSHARFCRDILDVIQQNKGPSLPAAPIINHIKTRCAGTQDGQKPEDSSGD